MDNGSEIKVPVLITGGAYAGLSTALGLAWRGVKPLVIERHPSTATLPKAWGINARARELLRNIPGVEAALQAAEAATNTVTFRAGPSLAASEPLEMDFETLLAFRSRLTSTPNLLIPQSTIEKVLWDAAEDLGADLRYGTELVSWTQTGDEVVATVREVDSGREYVVRADYLVAADGNASPIRQSLGVPTDGGGAVGHIYVVMFEADLPVFEPGHPKIVTVRGHGMSIIFDGKRLTLWVDYYPEQGQTDADFSPERCAELVREATGVPDLECRILNARPFTLNHRVARQFTVGRVVLAGDAAHACPPTGGQGGSLAIQDGCEVAWRLAMILKGQAGPSLMDGWEIERRPVVNLTVDREIELLKLAEGKVLATADPAMPIPTLKEMLGFRYHSPAVCTEPDDDLSLQEDPAQPSGAPGTRAPHVRLVRNGRELSTQELFGPGFVLLTDRAGTAWVDAAAKVSETLGVDVVAHTIGDELIDLEDAWSARYGVGRGGAVLVRPDGVIAWRAKAGSGSPEHDLDEALNAVLARR